MINILFIHQSSDLYGSDRTLLLLLKHIDRKKFFPVVILPNVGPLKVELEKENIEVVIAPVLKLYRKMFSPKNLITFFTDIKKGLKICDDLDRKYNFDIIYSNTLAVLLGVFFARKAKIKHIWHVHEIIVHPKIFANLFPHLLNKYADLVICNSISTKKNLTDRIGFLKQKTLVVYNGVEINKEKNTASTEGIFNFEKDSVIISLVGRISRLKGHKWLLETYLKYAKEMNNVKILFVGSPVIGQEYYLKEIEEIVKKNHLTNTVKILPFQKDLSQVWSITDIAIMPSTEAESFGLVAIEAMLANKPVIGSNHGGLTEIIVNNETGFLVEPNNEKQLSESLQKLIENEDLRKKFGNAGYQRAINQFSIDKYVSSIEKLFDKILK